MIGILLGDRFHAILVDNGCLRKDEVNRVVLRLKDKLNINLKVAAAADIFLDQLEGVTEPEKKRKIIGGLFIDVFQQEAKRIDEEIQQKFSPGSKVKFLLQGTLYPDVIESISYKV